MWVEPLIEFSAHLIGGSFIFIMIAVVAGILQVTINWIIEFFGLSPVFAFALAGVEYIIFTTDIVLYVGWVIKSAIHALKSGSKHSKKKKDVNEDDENC